MKNLEKSRLYGDVLLLVVVIIWGGVLGGVFLLALFIQLTALQYTTSSKQAFIASSYIMFTPLISWAFFRSRPAVTDFVAAVLMLTGVGFIGLNRAEEFQIGDFITLGFAVVFALQIILISRYTKELSAANITFFPLNRCSGSCRR